MLTETMAVRLISVKEAAAALSVTPTTLRRWAVQGRLRLVRLGRRTVRVNISDLEALIATPPRFAPPSPKPR